MGSQGRGTDGKEKEGRGEEGMEKGDGHTSKGRAGEVKRRGKGTVCALLKIPQNIPGKTHRLRIGTTPVFTE